MNFYNFVKGSCLVQHSFSQVNTMYTGTYILLYIQTFYLGILNRTLVGIGVRYFFNIVLIRQPFPHQYFMVATRLLLFDNNNYFSLINKLRVVHHFWSVRMFCRLNILYVLSRFKILIINLLFLLSARHLGSSIQFTLILTNKLRYTTHYYNLSQN